MHNEKSLVLCEKYSMCLLNFEGVLHLCESVGVLEKRISVQNYISELEKLRFKRRM